MKIPPSSFRLMGLAVAVATAGRAAPPVAVTDSYVASEDSPLSRPAAAGVLGNDNPNGNTIEAVLVSPASHGSLTLAADGSFTYSPAPNYNGADSFSYKARTLIPPVVFTIDANQSRVRVQGHVETPYGNGDDQDDSRVTGTISAVIHPQHHSVCRCANRRNAGENDRPG